MMRRTQSPPRPPPLLPTAWWVVVALFLLLCQQPQGMVRASSTSTLLQQGQPPPPSLSPEENGDEGDGTSQNVSITPYIVGGTTVAAGTYPWYVSPAGNFFCGGSLIYPDIVLTAAHCDLAFVVGEAVTIGSIVRGTVTTGAVARTIVRMIPHPDYDEVTVSNDFMLMQLNEPVVDIEPVILNANPNVPANSELVTVMGHGLVQNGGTVSLSLNEVDLFAISHNQCRFDYRAVAEISRDIMLCAGSSLNGKGSCQGDSGGPLVTADGVQVGVVSFGVECGLAQYPDVYARVSGAYDWIQQMICALSGSPPADCSDDIVRYPTEAPADDSVAVDTGKNMVEFVIQFDDEPQETSFLISQEGRVLYRGPVDYDPAPGDRWATEFAEFPAGSFRFTIRDTAGNGMQAGDTAGFFEIWQTLRDGTKVLLASGDGDFWYSQRAAFTVQPDGTATDNGTPTDSSPDVFTECTCEDNPTAAVSRSGDTGDGSTMITTFQESTECLPQACAVFDMNQEECEATEGCVFTRTAPIVDDNNNSFWESAGIYIVIVVVVAAVVFVGVLAWRRRSARTAADEQARGGVSAKAAGSDRQLRKSTSKKKSSKNKEKQSPNMSSMEYTMATTARTFSTTGGIDDDGLAYEDV